MKKIIAVGFFLIVVCGLAVGLGTAGDLSDRIVEFFSDDPDRPPFAQGEFDEADYIRRREEFVALLRGVDPTKPLDPESRSRAVETMDQQQAAARRLLAKLSPSQIDLVTLAWTELGPNPIPNGQTQTTVSAVSGRVTAIEIDPTDPNKVYVGTAGGGIFRSLDGGANWVPIFDSAQTLAIGSLNLDPVNGWLWVGTGEANGSGDSLAGVGLYRVENVNTSATLVGPINPVRNYTNGSGAAVSSGFFTGRSISKILRIPGDPSTLFVSIAGGTIGIGGNAPFGNSLPPLGMRGMVRLSNVNGPIAAITGTRLAVSTVDTGLGLCAFDLPCTVNRNVSDMVLDPQDPSGNELIVWLNGTNVSGDGGIYRSTNAMSASPTFTQTFVTTSTTTGNGRGELRAYARAGVTTVYTASGEPSTGGTLCNSATSFGSLRRSDDGGATWSAKLPGGGGFCAGQCFYNIGFDVTPGAITAADKLLLAGNVRSTSCAKLQGTSLDGGATVFANTDVGLHADTHVVKIAPSNVSVVYRGDDGGIWKSTDGGATWVSLNNTSFRATQFQSLAIHPTDPNFTIGGTQDNGTEKMTTGPTWTNSRGGDGGFVLIDQNATDTTNVTMYHTFFNQANSQIGYERSTDAGVTWPFNSICSNGLANGCTDTTNFYAPMTLGPGNPNPIYFGSDRLYRSATTGTGNVVVSQAPLVASGCNGPCPVSSIAISPQDDNYRIVGNNNGALWFTTTGASTLTSLDPVGGTGIIPDFYVARMAFDPANKNTVYIALGNYGNGTAAAQSHVWKITNLNTTPVITAANGSGTNVLPDVPVNGFAVDSLDPTKLYAGTDIGVFGTTDGGANWLPMGTGLPRVAVFDMAITNGASRKLRIATHGRGMWEIDLPIPTVSVSGRVFGADGRGLKSASVRMTDSLGNVRATISNSFGSYQFTDVSSQQAYTVSVASKRFRFTSQTVTVNAAVQNLDFNGVE